MSRTRSALDKVRGVIRELQGKLSAVQNQKRSRAEVKAYIGAAIDRWVSAANQQEARRLYACVAGEPVQFLTVHATVHTDTGAQRVSFDMGPVMVAMLGPDAVRDVLQRRLADLPEGMQAESRADAIAHLEHELSEQAAKEEGLLRDCWAEGDRVDYRPDADPAVVLTYGAPNS